MQSELVSTQRGGRFGMGSSRSGGGGEEDVREEQDMPYCSSLDGGLSSGEYFFDGNDDEDNEDEGESDRDEEDDEIHDSRLKQTRRDSGSISSRRRKSQQRPREENNDDDDDSSISPLQQLTPQITATRELAHRLHSAGLPFASEVKKMETSRNGGRRRAGRSSTTSTTVEDILQSLTRAEGNVLSQTLLSPLDDGMINGKNEAIEEEGGMVSAAAAAWNAIGGLSDAKESLLDLAFPLLPTSTEHNNNSDDDHYYGGLLSNPPGVLLYGPPGCGKGLLVRALASTIHARFLIVSPSVLLRKYVGETNLNVRALFSVARKLSPTVIFVDELDGLFRERGGEDHDVGRDLKTEFLQLWDGIRNHRVYGGGGASSSSTSSILVIGATNRPFDVDPAFLRRMPRKIYVGLPDYDSRISVLQGMLRRVPLDVNFDVGLVATKTEGYSPSDIREVLQTAALFPLREARAEAIRDSSASFSSSVDGEIGNYAEKKVGMTPTMPALRRLRTEDVLRALKISRPTHFSRKYQKEMMNYICDSGALNPQRQMDRDDHPPPSVVDASENYYPDSSSPFSEDGSNQQPQEEADISSYDEDSSDSDYDDL